MGAFFFFLNVEVVMNPVSLCYCILNVSNQISFTIFILYHILCFLFYVWYFSNQYKVVVLGSVVY